MTRGVDSRGALTGGVYRRVCLFRVFFYKLPINHTVAEACQSSPAKTPPGPGPRLRVPGSGSPGPEGEGYLVSFEIQNGIVDFFPGSWISMSGRIVDFFPFVSCGCFAHFWRETHPRVFHRLFTEFSLKFSLYPL